VIIALGYRVQSPVAVRFRRWATQRLHEYIQKGFTMDDERLKQARDMATMILDDDPLLSKPENQVLVRRMHETRGNRLDWSNIS
jgi:hypothetical protein